MRVVSFLNLAQNNVSLLVGFLLLLLTFAAARLIHEAQLCSELRPIRNALWAFLVVQILRIILRLAWPLSPYEEHSSPLTDEHTWTFGFLGATAMLLLAFALVRLVVSIGLWMIRHFRQKPTTKIMKDLLNWGLLLLAVFPILQTQFNLNVSSLLAPSAILSVVLGLALQDTLGNLFSGLALRSEQPFEVGDVVDLGGLSGQKDHVGQVVQIGWRSIRIQTFRNEILTLPNGAISKTIVKNLSQKGLNIGIETEFLISYDIPPNKVRTEILEAIDEIAFIVEEPAPFCRVKSFDDSAVRYQVRVFTTNIDRYMLVKDELLTRLWYRFERNNIEFGLPRRIIHSNAFSKEEPSPSQSLLDNVDLFSLFSPQERAQLAHSAKERRFGTGEEIISAGEEGHTFYLVVSGRVSVRVDNRIELAQLSKNQYFGEMSLLTGEPRTATVIALEDSVLLEFGRECFAQHFANNPQLTESLSKLLAARRTELAKANAAPETPLAVVHQSETHRIFTRLRQIFGLRQH
ncbi:MAG: mechanosensitive ion channel family protein [Proteobacteria bacterium]|nr:mechanosensitive ion channel family protein [Cystobacterineae bacterium]MCL2259546.1 mechanosensitive ion channel family protein [Cystobacterineae bacterium]MCL2313978.1 mechanosensitive ion channel family protein [Pseudomonadota bacterium]